MPILQSNEDPGDLTIKDLFDIKKELPEGVSYESLTEDEKKRIRNSYRFSGYKPGSYQTLSGFGGMS